MTSDAVTGTSPRGVPPDVLCDRASYGPVCEIGRHEWTLCLGDFEGFFVCVFVLFSIELQLFAERWLHIHNRWAPVPRAETVARRGLPVTRQGDGWKC